MNELLATLTNLSYELFGVILPGIVASIFILLYWIALGPVAPLWTSGIIPAFTMTNLQALFDSLSLASGIGVAIPLLAIWYFLGHILLWIARSGKADAAASKGSVRRVVLSLVLQIPKPANPFDPNLKPLYNSVRKRFTADGAELDWRQFYPVVKSYLSQRLTYSLVATYQNKYTFHRSVAIASAVLFWFSVLTIATALVFGAPGVNWALLLALLGGAVLLVWGFSGSYMYHWGMFGDTIITEAYSLLYGPKNADPLDAKSSSDRSRDHGD